MNLGTIFSSHSSQITHNDLIPAVIMQDQQKAASWENYLCGKNLSHIGIKYSDILVHEDVQIFTGLSPYESRPHLHTDPRWRLHLPLRCYVLKREIFKINSHRLFLL